MDKQTNMLKMLNMRTEGVSCCTFYHPITLDSIFSYCTDYAQSRLKIKSIGDRTAVTVEVDDTKSVSAHYGHLRSDKSDTVVRGTCVPLPADKDGLVCLPRKAQPMPGRCSDVPYAWVDGKAYRVDSQGYLVDFVDTDGRVICVNYYINDDFGFDITDEAHILSTDSSDAYCQVIAEFKVPVFGNEISETSASTRIGVDTYTFPVFFAKWDSAIALSKQETGKDPYARTLIEGYALPYSNDSDKRFCATRSIFG